MTDKHLEAVSALLDDELKDKEFDSCFDELRNDDKMTRSYARYSLIGDVLRNEQTLVTDAKLADAVQEAIANVELPNVGEQVVSISSHPSWGQRVKQLAVSSVGKASAQFAIAASVAMVAIVGVNNMSTEQASSSPVISTNPLINGVSPVSMNAQGNANRPTANQLTQSRINALIADHNQQLKVNGESKDENEEAEENKQP
jgi:sigma-E factor negative regulatory protein RseA